MAVIKGRPEGTRFRGYIEGGPELAAKLQALEKATRDELLVQVMDSAAEVIEDEWRARVEAAYGRGPGTAHYVDAIGHRSRPGKRGATAYVGLPNEVPQEAGEAHPRDYAPKLEFTRTPTLRPAFDTTREKALEVMGREAWRLIEEALR